MKKALITGISGQDGSFLSELLLSKGYEVHGIVMRLELEDVHHRLQRLENVIDHVKLHPAELESFPSIHRVFNEVKPDECYHLAAQSFVDYSFDNEFSTMNININGTHNVLAALKMVAPECKFYFAGSSEMFGNVSSSPQDERTPFNPRSIYGISKVAGFFLSTNYRRLYNIFSCNGILFNHESERRGFEYVTRKITSSVALIKIGKLNKLKLGNLDAKRDWGYAPDYVNAMWKILQRDEPDDFVIGTGKSHSVKEFIEIAFSTLDLDWNKYIEVSPEFFRPAEDVQLVANPQKAIEKIEWKPTLGFEEIVKKMVLADYQRVRE